MPLPVIASVSRVAFNWVSDVNAWTAENVMHFSTDTLTSSQLATQLNIAASTNMFAGISNDMHCSTCSITPLNGTAATQDFALSDWNGAQLGQAVPAAAHVITLRTGIRGRSHRGRIYLPGVAEDVMDNGLILGASNDSAQAAWTTFLTDIAAAGANLVVASYTLETADDVTTVHAQQVVGTQRRRQSRLRT